MVGIWEARHQTAPFFFRAAPLAGGASHEIDRIACCDGGPCGLPAHCGRTGIRSTAWGDCVANVVRLDDGKSDPVSIAYGIAPQRGELHAQLTNIMVSHNITENGQIAMRERMKSGEVQMITSAILTFRAARNRPVQPLDRHRAQARP